MRRLIPAVCLLLVAAACGGDEGAETTTSALETTSSTTPETTTSTVADTTTTVAETTTSTEGTTTTTEPPGNWAAEPLVVSEFGALGWWDGGNWVQVDELTALPVSGGEDYQVAFLGLEAGVTGGPETLLCEPLNNPGVELSNTDILGGFPGPSGVAISAPWELVPHFVQDEVDDGTYSDFARPLLASRGLDVENPVIKQVVRFDIEGDGVNEVIAVAEDIADDGLFAQVGDYSLAFLRRVVDGEVQTAILGDSVVTPPDPGVTPFVLSYAVAAIADLSGDGKMEIVMNSVYYEGVGWGVWEYVNDDLGPVLQIQSGCGA